MILLFYFVPLGGGINPKDLASRLWGDMYFSPKT